MRSVIVSFVCLLSLLFVPTLGAPFPLHLPSTNPSSNSLPSVHELATHEPRIHLAPIKLPSTRLSSTRLPSIHQLPIPQPSTHQPSTRQPPTHPRAIRPRPIPPSAHPPPPHGQIVAFQSNIGRHAGVILGSQPDQQRKFKVAPVNILGHNPAQGPVFSAPLNQVAKVHQDNLVGTNMMAPKAALDIMRYHEQHPPVETHVAAPIYGSRNDPALHGSARPGGRRRR